jgi:23S rRNA (guanosine2251-2'-O)-methyltransferase
LSHGQAHPGWHAAHAALTKHPEWVLKLWVLQGRDDARSGELVSLAKSLGITIEYVSKTALDKQDKRHQGVIAWLKEHTLPAEDALFDFLTGLQKDAPLVLVLDGVQDPHNLGACLRTADAVGVDAVIIPRHHATGITPTVSKVACGAAESLAVFQVTNLSRTLDVLKTKGFWVNGLALAEGAQSVFNVDWHGPLAIVMGSEDTGLRPLTMKQCDRLVIIPMLGSVQSLNVSVATGVVLYTALQQRIK